MKISTIATCSCIALAGLALCAGFTARGQDSPDQSSTQSLGDAARKARQEHAAAGHVAARQSVNEEDDGPDLSGVWRVKLCSRTPCYELSIALPKHPKWTRAAEQPRPVLIPLAGHEQDRDHDIRIYSGEALAGIFAPVAFAKRGLLQDQFSRPEYFGQSARMLRDWPLQIDGSPGIITLFTVFGGSVKYRGLSVVVASPNGSYGFACVFRDEDTTAAGSICEAIVKSARNQSLEPAKPQIYPTYQPSPDDPYDPADDPPDDSDPE